jgi:hypothetical protein
MSDRVRVYELARELGLTNKELIQLLQDEGLDVKSHSSTVDNEFAVLVRDHVISERQKEQAEALSLAEQIDLVTQGEPEDEAEAEVKMVRESCTSKPRSL